MVLGYLPEEYIGHVVEAIESSSNDPEKLTRLVDEMVLCIRNDFSSAEEIFRRLMSKPENEGNGIKWELFANRSVTRWIDENRERFPVS